MLRLPLRSLRILPAKSNIIPQNVYSHVAQYYLGRRRYATVTDLENHPKPGEQIHGFTVKRAKNVSELQLTALHLQHEKTGTEYLHIARDDKNNVFSIGFKTNPPDATGVPHILEHTTLCGSQKYPIRDPFFKMLPRSLSNFMNAFTSSDHTTYPFATTNRRDFQNLMSVYLDSTLNPLLKENDFLQEGWRIGPQNPRADEAGKATDPENQELVFKGVVYNEMKGQVSDSSYLYHVKFQDHIFPDINNSGGDPQKMTDLTYQSLKDFHTRNYHPSNAKIFTYGDMPLADHLQQIDNQLGNFERSEPDTAIKDPIDLSKGPCFETTEGPLDPLMDEKKQHKTSTTWLMGDTSDVVESFSLSVISSLLLDGYGSPMYQALVESGLGSDFSPNTGFDGGARKGIFSIGLNGVREADVPRVKKTIQATLKEVREIGFDNGKVDGLLHQLEIALKHKTANFGLGLMQRLEPGWFNGVDPFVALEWDKTINTFKRLYAEPQYLENLLERYLLNDFTLTFTMEPSPTYSDQIKKEENLRLEKKILEAAKLEGGHAEAHKNFTARELELLEAQTKANSEDLSCLPSVHIKDIPRQMEKKLTRRSSLGPVKVQWREASTNGLTYFRAINEFQGLPTDLRMLLPLFTASVMRLGTREKSVEQIEDLIKLKTGGISLSYHSAPSPTDMTVSKEGLCVSASALDKNIPDMYDLISIIIQEIDFDAPMAEDQIRQLLQQDASGALDTVASAGHSFASRYAQAGITTQGLLNEQTSGLTQLQQTAILAGREPRRGLEDIIRKLKLIQEFAISNSSSLRTAVTCGHGAASDNRNALENFLRKFPNAAAIPNPQSLPSADIYRPSTFFPLPYQVYYSAYSLPTVSYTDPAGAPLQILSQLLTHKHLHHEIREKGGAYGGGASARGLSGIFNFYSYRDPNPQNSLNIMKDAGRWARDRDWTSRDLEEAMLSSFQSIDAPTSVSEDGMVHFLSGITESMEQRKREQLLAVNKTDIRDIAQRFLVDGVQNARTAILGEQQNWATEDNGWSVQKIQLNESPEVGSGGPTY